MAIVRTAGTEIIRCWAGDGLNNSGRIIIKGVQHHIYTILNITVFAYSIQAEGNYVKCFLSGFDSIGGTPSASIELFRQEMSGAETFVWDNKFSFNGVEPIAFTGPMDTAIKQDALADQAHGSGLTQQLYLEAEHASDNFHAICTLSLIHI